MNTSHVTYHSNGSSPNPWEQELPCLWLLSVLILLFICLYNLYPITEWAVVFDLGPYPVVHMAMLLTLYLWVTPDGFRASYGKMRMKSWLAVCKGTTHPNWQWMKNISLYLWDKIWTPSLCTNFAQWKNICRGGMNKE